MRVMAEDRAISWNWSEALHGALCCLPAAVILLATDVRLGIGFAIGVLPVALMGVLPSRRQSLQGLLLVMSRSAVRVPSSALPIPDK